MNHKTAQEDKFCNVALGSINIQQSVVDESSIFGSKSDNGSKARSERCTQSLYLPNMEQRKQSLTRDLQLAKQCENQPKCLSVTFRRETRHFPVSRSGSTYASSAAAASILKFSKPKLVPCSHLVI